LIYVATQTTELTAWNMYALNPDGSQAWMRTLANPHGGSGSDYRMPGASAALGDGVIYIGCTANFYAINPGGTVKWTYHTGDAPEDLIAYAPAVGPDGAVYCTTQKLVALTSGGALRWEYFPDGNAQCAPPTVDAAGTVYSCVGLEGAVHALNPDGTEKWSFDTSSDLGGVSIGADGTLYFANDGGDVYALGPGAQ
jgi:outer membrane protein assembly factor BamB